MLCLFVDAGTQPGTRWWMAATASGAWWVAILIHAVLFLPSCLSNALLIVAHYACAHAMDAPGQQSCICSQAWRSNALAGRHSCMSGGHNSSSMQRLHDPACCCVRVSCVLWRLHYLATQLHLPCCCCCAIVTVPALLEHTGLLVAPCRTRFMVSFAVLPLVVCCSCCCFIRIILMAAIQ